MVYGTAYYKMVEENKPSEKQVSFMQSKNLPIPHTKQQAIRVIGEWIKEQVTDGDVRPTAKAIAEKDFDFSWEDETPEEPKDNGFHLTPEQCRSNALESALGIRGPESDGFWDLVRSFEDYIVKGEITGE